jgi:hypothetical protein
VTPAEVQTRCANPEDAEAIASAHLDSIRSIGPTFYPPEVVREWASGITPDLYVKAMEGGEAFFIATGHIDGQPSYFYGHSAPSCASSRHSRGKGLPSGSDPDPGHGFARLLGRPRNPLLPVSRLQTHGPGGPGGRKAVNCR